MISWGDCTNPKPLSEFWLGMLFSLAAFCLLGLFLAVVSARTQEHLDTCSMNEKPLKTAMPVSVRTQQHLDAMKGEQTQCQFETLRSATPRSAR